MLLPDALLEVEPLVELELEPVADGVLLELLEQAATPAVRIPTVTAPTTSLGYLLAICATPLLVLRYPTSLPSANRVRAAAA
jgi:hypothetical protein